MNLPLSWRRRTTDLQSLDLAPPIEIVDAPIRAPGAVRLALSSAWASFHNLLRFGPRERIDWYESMAEMRHAKVTTEEALATITAGNVKFKRAAAAVYSAMLPVVRRGRPIDEAARPFVPPTEAILLAAGDRGSTPAGYAAAAKLLRAVLLMRGTLVKYLAYPLAMLAVSAPVIFLLADKLVPVGKRLAQGRELGASEAAFIVFADLYTANIGFVVAGLVTLIVALVLSLGRWTGGPRRWADRWLPPYIIYRYYSASVFLAALGALLRTEMGVDVALTHLSVRANPYLRWHLEPIILTYRKGENEAAAFDTGLLDHNMLIRITAMARSGSIKEAITRMSDDVVQYSIELIGRVGMILAGTIFVFVFAFIVWALAFIYNLGFAAADQVNAVNSL